MEEHDIYQDSLLKIHTTGRDDSHSDFMNFPYEATPYPVLERLAYSGYLTKKNTLIDYGCGKGRVDFYLSFLTKCTSIGIEYNELLYGRAIKNKETALSKNRTAFYHVNAEDYEIPSTADSFYFFNPFCVDILKTVLFRIRRSKRENPRDIHLLFYYISEKYEAYLSEQSDIHKIEEIDCRDLFPKEDVREKITIYEM